MGRYRLGRRRVADTILAATLLHHRVEALPTANASDFRIFEGMEIIDPTA